MTDDRRAASTLTDVIESYQPVQPDIGQVIARSRTLHRRRVATSIGATAIGTAAAVVVAIAITTSGSGHKTSRTLNGGAPTVHHLPTGPLSGRYDVASAWTGSQLFVWGGASNIGSPTNTGVTQAMKSDGALYTPATKSWSTIAASPLSGRSHAVAVSTSRGVLVAGGGTASAFDPSRHDAAIYRPATDSWRSVASSPTCPESGLAANKLVYVVGRCATGPGDFGPAEFASYDASTNDWTMLPAPRMSGDITLHRWGNTILAGNEVGEVERYDLASNSWRRLLDVPTGIANSGTQLTNLRYAAVGGKLIVVAEQASFSKMALQVYSNGGWTKVGPFTTDPPGSLLPDALTRTGDRLSWIGEGGVGWIDLTTHKTGFATASQLGVDHTLAYAMVQPTTPGTVIVWGGQTSASTDDDTAGTQYTFN